MISLRAGRTARGRLHALRSSRLHISIVLPLHTWLRLRLGLALALALRLSLRFWACRATGWWLHAFCSMLGGGSLRLGLGLGLGLGLRFRLRLSAALLRLWA